MASRLGLVTLVILGVATCTPAVRTPCFVAPAVAARAVSEVPPSPITWPRPAALVKPAVRVQLYDLNRMTALSVSIPVDGRVDAATAAQLLAFFRCRRTHKSHRMDPGLLAMLADVGQHYPGRVVEIMSAYRSPPYGAPHSRHFLGRALDLRVRGIKLTAFRNYLWARHAGTGVGVGYYPGSGFVHMDYRPDRGDAAWTQRNKWSRYRYHPAWSRVVLAAAR